MKRKLTSSGPRKGNQEITKFFKSLTPQGSRNSCPGMGESVKQAEMIPTDGFREPILEKLQAVKNRFASEQSSREVCLRNGEERDEGSVKMDIGSDTSYLTSSTVGPVKRLEKSSTILTCRVVNNGTIQENGSFARDSVEESDMECDESFFSARGELSTINNNESFEDAVRSPPCNSNDTVTTKSATQKKPLDCKDPLSEPEVQDLSKSLCVDLKMKDPSKTEARNCSDIIVVNCNKTCVEKNTLLQSACIDEDSQDELLLEGSESSDEDLLTPPRFLSEKNRLKPDIRTPEKGIAPEYSSPITPSPAVKETREDKSFNYKLSFNKLISEKAKRREKDAELAEMEAELQRGIQNGGVAQIEPYCFSDMESEEEQIDDGRDLQDCALPQDIKKFLVEVHDFSEELPGEDVFPMFLPCAIPQDIPCLAKVTPPERDTFEAKLASASELDLQELLCGGWILQYYLNKPCSVEVAEWLFQIMCQHQDQHIVSLSFQVLWVMLDAATEKRDDLPPISRGISWLPSVRKVILELLSYGATLHRLYPDSLADDLNVHELMSSDHSTRITEAEDSTLVNSGVKTENFPVVNTMHLVQFLTYGLQKCPLLYTVQDLRQLVVLLCRLALDVRLQTVVFDIEMCIAAALNYFEEAQWPDEVKELCRIVAKLSTDHRNLLHLVQIQPPSVRGIYLQRLLSLSLLHWLVPRFMSHRYQEGTGKFPTNERCNVDVPDSVQVSCLVKLAEKLKAGEHSDYFLLHSVVSLLSLAVGAEDVAPEERTALERLTSRLRALNGDIKDPRAAFMDRTKVKDLLVRTIHRLAYMTQCIKPAREQHITTYFERSSSDYQIELLKETADPAEKEGVGDEKLADEKQMESSEEKRNTAE